MSVGVIIQLDPLALTEFIGRKTEQLLPNGGWQSLAARRANFTLTRKIGQDVIDFVSVSADKFGNTRIGKVKRWRRWQQRL